MQSKLKSTNYLLEYPELRLFMTQQRAIIFDLDDTLCDWQAAQRGGEQAIIAGWCIQMTLNRYSAI